MHARAHGVGAFPDPDASGALTIDAVANGSLLDTNSAAFEQAVSACKDLEPSGFTGRQRSPQEQKAALEFAARAEDSGSRVRAGWPGKHRREVLEQLEPAVERSAGNHVEGDIGITVVDPVVASAPGDHGEDDHTETVD